ncbi:hypothetical protein TNCV_1810321 [Trichonephila clavipes]|nr:hypothetical protein TNCV_1810321 [Trichonephila clavipes]
MDMSMSEGTEENARVRTRAFSSVTRPSDPRLVRRYRYRHTCLGSDVWCAMETVSRETLDEPKHPIFLSLDKNYSEFKQ